MIASTILFLSLFSCGFAQDRVVFDEWESLQCDDYLARMENIVATARSDWSSKIYVIAYEGREMQYNSKGKYELMLPQYGSAKAKIKSMKEYLKFYNKSSENFVFIEGGFKEKAKIEIFIVPNGAIPPKPTPTLTKMKYRKGKPRGFCLYCC